MSDRHLQQCLIDHRLVAHAQTVAKPPGTGIALRPSPQQHLRIQPPLLPISGLWRSIALPRLNPKGFLLPRSNGITIAEIGC